MDITFSCFYFVGVGGSDGNGDIMKSENLEEFQNFVLDNTNEQGVHFVMADGVSEISPASTSSRPLHSIFFLI